MGISPLRLFLATNQRLTTYSRFLCWSYSTPSAVISRQRESQIFRGCSSSGASTKARPPKPHEEAADGRRNVSTRSSPYPKDGGQVSASQDDRTLPDILEDISKDKQVIQTFTDASEASESINKLRRETKPSQTAAFEVLDKIEDVEAFIKELNKSQKRVKSHSKETRDEGQVEASSSSLRRGKGASSIPLNSYRPEQLSEEISIIIGRDAKRKRFDVSVQQVVDVVQDLDRRIERQIPDVDNMRVPKGRNPLIMALKMWIPQKSQFAYTSISDLNSAYMRLAKSRLTMFVTLSAVGGYFIAPFEFSLMAFTGTIVGTTLCSGAANSINQLIEIPFDSQMARTRDRPLVRAQLSPLHAATFALVSASLGTSVLYFSVNEIVAALGFLNLLLYTCVYTPMKRFTIFNTWAGAIVGAIPPLMGWAAATGSLGAGSLLFAGVLYSWQFPHFNALSWNMRADYSRAGYCMMAVTNPGLCKRVALRHCIFLHGICFLAPILGVTNWFFACDSFILNAIFTYYAWKFYRDGDAKSSRNLFRFSLLYLPIILVFLLISKKRSNPEQKKKGENFHALSSILGM